METELSLSDIFEILKRNIFIVIVLAGLGAAIGIALALNLPKQYKAKSQVSIQGSYFKNPLVSEIVSEVHDPTEIRAQRNSLIQLALNPTFLDELGSNLQFYSGDSATLQLERELLRERIEYFSLNSTNFQISVIDNDPNRAFQALESTLERVRRTFSEQRLRKLEAARDALQTSLNELQGALDREESLEREKDVRAIRRELERVERDLEGLLEIFSPLHPKVQKLRSKKASLSKDLDSRFPEIENQSGSTPGAFLALGAKEDLQSLHSKLLSRLSNLSLVLSIERNDGVLSYVNVIEAPVVPIRPFYPSKKNFAIYGFLLGLICGLVFAAVRELHRGTLLEPETASREFLGLELLGEFPTSKSNLLAQLPKQRLPLPPGPALLAWNDERAHGTGNS